MGEYRGQIPALQEQTPEVDFIDNRLPTYNPAFSGSPSAFDSVSNRYVPRVLPASILGLVPPNAPAQAALITPDGKLLDTQSMKFWDELFPNAMGQLVKTVPEPRNLSKSGGIRTATSWKEICDRLNASKDTYTGEEGMSGMFRKGRRKVADNLSQPAAHIAKLVPDIDPWVTPVVGTVGLLVQAMSTAAKARQDVLKSLADLDRTFADINRFAATFPRDPHVREASVALVVAIFQAVERAISFFAQSTASKAASAVFKGADYQKELMDSFHEIQQRSGRLIQQAQSSHWEGTSAAMQQLLSGSQHMMNLLLDVFTGQAQQSAIMKNEIRSMLDVYARGYEADRQRQKEEAARQSQMFEMLMRNQHEMMATVNQLATRPVSPLLLAPPPPPPTYPVPARPFVELTPQNLFALLSVPGAGDLGISDVARVKEQGATLVSARDKKRADQVIQTQHFRHWMGTPGRARLLVHGTFRGGGRTVSALSLLIATLAEALRERPTDFVCLTFFCGSHLDVDEGDGDAPPSVGGPALVRALLAQLLLQRPDPDTRLAAAEADMDLVQRGDVGQLCALLGLLVRRLPAETTVFILLDGLVYYERDEYADGADLALAEIMRLAAAGDVAANVKVLAASPWPTDAARRWFRDDAGEILHMQSMPTIELTPSASRTLPRQVSGSGADSDWSSDGSRESSPGAWDSPSRR